MSKFEIGPLPKIEGAGRKSAGKWPGHAEEAAAVKQYALDNPKDTENYLKIAEGLKVHTASRIASLINKGVADDFQPDHTGSFRASARRHPQLTDEHGRPLYDIWARYDYTGPVKARRRRPVKATSK
jgi:hypothetical protein